MQRLINGWPRRAVLAACLALSTLLAHAEVYRWTDENGQVHYGQRPPPGGAQQMDFPKTPAESARPDTQAARRARQQRMLEAYEYEREKKRAEAERTARSDRRKAANCRTLQKRWRLLSFPGPVYFSTNNGDRDYLSDERRAAAKAELRPAYVRACGEDPPA